MGSPGSIVTTNFLKTELYLLSEAENGRKLGIRSGFTDRIFCSTWDEPGRILFKSELLMPGEHITAYLLFLNEVPILKNMPFTLRESGKSVRTVGRGLITEVLQPVPVTSYRKLNENELMEAAVALQK